MAKVTRSKSPTGRLSDEQYDLMLFLFIRGVAFEPIPWSPSAFLESRDIPITKPRLSVVSRRLTSLIERGLLSRDEEGVAFVQLGVTVLFDYAKQQKRLELMDVLEHARSYWVNHHYSLELSRTMGAIEGMGSETDLREGPDAVETRDLMELIDRAAVMKERLDRRAERARAAYERLISELNGRANSNP